MPPTRSLPAPSSPEAHATYAALAETVFLSQLQRSYQGRLPGRRPVPRPDLLADALQSVAILPVPPADAVVARCRELTAGQCLVVPAPSGAPQMADPWHLLRDLMNARDATVPAAWLAWFAATPTDAVAFWTALLHPQSPVDAVAREWADALLLDTLRLGIGTGACPATRVWALAQTATDPRATIRRLWEGTARVWQHTPGAIPAPEVAFVEAALALPRPSGRTPRAVHSRSAAWREHALELLRGQRHRPEAEALIAAQVQTPDERAPYTDDELVFATLSRTAAPAEALAVVHRLPIPLTVGMSLSPTQESIFELAERAGQVGLASDAVWRALWARASQPFQRFLLLLHANLAAAGPWWRDPDFARDALEALATTPTPWMSAMRSAVTTDQLHSLAGLPGCAGAWLRAYAHGWPLELPQAFWILRHRTPAWVLTPTDLAPFLSADDASVRAEAQLLLARTTDAGPAVPSSAASSPAPRHAARHR